MTKEKTNQTYGVDYRKKIIFNGLYILSSARIRVYFLNVFLQKFVVSDRLCCGNCNFSTVTHDFGTVICNFCVVNHVSRPGSINHYQFCKVPGLVSVNKCCCSCYPGPVICRFFTVRDIPACCSEGPTGFSAYKCSYYALQGVLLAGKTQLKLSSASRKQINALRGMQIVLQSISYRWL